LHWSKGEWIHPTDTSAQPTSIGINFVDIKIEPADRAPIRFTFLWLDNNSWEGCDYVVEVRPV
jgi:glucoamylase